MLTELSTLANEEVTAPRRTIEIRPDDFSDMKGRPETPVLAGLRILTIQQRQDIPRWVKRYAEEYGVKENEAEMRLCVSHALCDANDVAKPFRLFQRPQDQVFSHLTYNGARYIFDSLLKLEVETSRVYLEATPDDIEQLYKLIADGGLETLGEADYSTALRHLRFAYDILAGND